MLERNRTIKRIPEDSEGDIIGTKEKLLYKLWRCIERESESPEASYFLDGYENRDRFEVVVRDLSIAAREAFEQRDFADVIDIGRGLLEAIGVDGARTVSTQNAGAAIAVAEAINLSAKTFSPDIYHLKPLMVVAAWKLGADFGLGEDDAYYLGTDSVGVASFHDPWGEIGDLVVNVLGEKPPVWEHPWSGVIRQDEARDILNDLSSGGALVKKYVDNTSTEEMRRIRKKYMVDQHHIAKAKMAEMLAFATVL